MRAGAADFQRRGVASGSLGTLVLILSDLVRLDMQPDLGVLNLLLAPFMPKMDAWFNPNDNWNYVGGEFDRYFRGPHVLTVRVPSQD